MRNPYGVLITGCTGLPAEVTLRAPCNGSGFFCRSPAGRAKAMTLRGAASPQAKDHSPTSLGFVRNVLIHTHSPLLQGEARHLTEPRAKAIPALGDGNLPSPAGDSRVFSFPAFPITFLSKQLFTGVGSL